MPLQGRHRDRHQTPAHIIVSDDGQQAAVQYAKLFAKYLPDNEQRLDQLGHIGRVLDQLPDTRLELDRSHDPHLETEVSQRATEVIVEGNGLRVHKLAKRFDGLSRCSRRRVSYKQCSQIGLCPLWS